jgi:fumarate hydratase class II
MRPIIINNFLHSARILSDACEKLRRFSVEGTRLNHKRVDEMVDRSRRRQGLRDRAQGE